MMRLFTERDVLMLMKVAHDEGWRTGANGGGAFYRASDGLREFEEKPPRYVAPLTFPADEPLFLLRGQDSAAPAAIAGGSNIDYAQACLNAGAPGSYLRAVWVAAAAMRDWQSEHSGRVKVPS